MKHWHVKVRKNQDGILHYNFITDMAIGEKGVHSISISINPLAYTIETHVRTQSEKTFFDILVEGQQYKKEMLLEQGRGLSDGRSPMYYDSNFSPLASMGAGALEAHTLNQVLLLHHLDAGLSHYEVHNDPNSMMASLEHSLNILQNVDPNVRAVRTKMPSMVLSDMNKDDSFELNSSLEVPTPLVYVETVESKGTLASREQQLGK